MADLCGRTGKKPVTLREKVSQEVSQAQSRFPPDSGLHRDSRDTCDRERGETRNGSTNKTNGSGYRYPASPSGQL